MISAFSRAHGIDKHQESSSGVGGHLSCLFLCFVVAATDLGNQSVDHQKENDHNEGEVKEDGVDTVINKKIYCETSIMTTQGTN